MGTAIQPQHSTDEASQATASDIQVVVCEYCDAAYKVLTHSASPHLMCTRCLSPLQHGSRLSVDVLLALTITAIVAMLFTQFYPIVSIELNGTVRSATIWSAAAAVVNIGSGLVAALVLATLLFFPALELVLLSWLLSYLALGKRCPGFKTTLKLLREIRPWCMVEVFAVSLLVALAKMLGLAQVSANIGLLGLAIWIVLLTTLSNIDLHALWDRGDKCLLKRFEAQHEEHNNVCGDGDHSTVEGDPHVIR